MEIKAQKFDAVIIEDYNKGVLSDSFIEVLMNLFSEKNIPVLVDPKKNNFFSYYKATVFKPNLREAREALGKNFNTTIIELNQVHEDLVKKFSHQCTFITLGDKGAYINDGK